MAITYVGGQVAGRAGIASTASITFALTGGTHATPQAGDLVIITAVVGSQARNPAQAISGYTALGQLNPNTTTYDTSMNVSWKFMGKTPDTTFTLPSTGNIADAQRYTIQVFRDVDTTTPMDVTPVSATGTATGRPNPGSITPVTAGAWVVICGGGAAATGAAYVAPANFTTGFLTGFTADTNDAMVGSGYWSGWSSGAVDPAAYTGGTANAVDSWAAYTIALRPAAANGAPTVLPASTIDSGAGVSLINLPSGWAVGDYLVALVQTAGGEAAGIDAGWPGWTQIASADTGTTGIGSARLTLFGKFAASGETNPDTTDSGDHQLTTMIGFRGVDPTTPVELSSTGFNATASTAVTLTSPGTTGGANRLLATFVASGLDSAATTTYSLWNNANANLVERQDNGTVAGIGGTFGIATGRLPTAGVVGNAGVTQTSSQAVWIALVLQPASTAAALAGTPAATATATGALTTGIQLAGAAAAVATASGTLVAGGPAAELAGTPAATATATGALTTAIKLAGTPAAAATATGALTTAIKLAGTPAATATATGALTTAIKLAGAAVATATATGEIHPSNDVRYIRDRTRGSATPADQATYWCGIQALNGAGTNFATVANGASMIANLSYSVTGGTGTINDMIDGTPDTTNYAVSGDPYSGLMVDLGQVRSIKEVKIYRYWADSRVFLETLVETSVDGKKWTTLWDSSVDGTYAESASGKTLFTKPSSPPPDVDRGLGTIIPLYTTTAGVWTTFQGTAADIPSVAIFNPASGPGSSYDSAYGAKVDAFRAAGGKVIGYVSTSYAGTINTARTTTAVNADVLKYHQWYNIDGIFFDEWAPESTYTSYASTIYSYLKGLNPSYWAVGNAGPKVAEVYLSAPYVDNVVIYEETGAKYLNWTMPSWAKNYSSTRFSIMIHTATSGQMDIAVGRSKYENVGFVYVTDDVMANPWDVAPTFWSTEVAAMKGLWTRPTAVATATGTLTPSVVALAGTPAAVATATGALTTGIALAGAPAAVATATGALTVGSSLGAAPAAVATATGALTTGIQLAATPTAVAAATGALITSIRLAGTPAAVAAATGAITTGIKLAGAPAATASATGALTTQIRLAGAPAAVATASGTLASTSPPLAASAAAVASATGNLTTAIQLAAGGGTSKLADPATLPGGYGRDTAFSSDGVYMAVAHTGAPYLTIYKRNGDVFTKLADPATLPTSNAYGVAFSQDTTYLAVAHTSAPHVTIYKRSGDVFTKLADPATIPFNAGTAVDFSADGTYLAVTHFTTPFVSIYKRSGDVFTKLADPATLPPDAGQGVAFSPSGSFMSVAHFTTPFVTIYSRSGDVFTKLANPATLPNDSGLDTAFSPDSAYMAVSHWLTPFVTVYSRSGNVFTKVADPDVLPTGPAFGVAFSPDGLSMSVAHDESPYVTNYARSGATLTKKADPTTLPSWAGYGVSFSPDSVYTAVAHDISPNVTIYKAGSSGAGATATGTLTTSIQLAAAPAAVATASGTLTDSTAAVLAGNAAAVATATGALKIGVKLTGAAAAAATATGALTTSSNLAGSAQARAALTGTLSDWVAGGFWVPVVDVQSAAWQTPSDAQTSGWVPVVDTQAVTWQNTSSPPVPGWTQVDDTHAPDWVEEVP